MKRFEGSNGLDTALYKKLPFYLFYLAVLARLLKSYFDDVPKEYWILIVQLQYVLCFIIPCIRFAIIMDYWALMFPTLFVLVGPFDSVSWV